LAVVALVIGSANRLEGNPPKQHRISWLARQSTLKMYLDAFISFVALV
jgi:hypothetical protein